MYYSKFEQEPSSGRVVAYESFFITEFKSNGAMMHDRS